MSKEFLNILIIIGAIIFLFIAIIITISSINKSKETIKNNTWKDRKHILGLPISFTVYSLDYERLFVTAGLFTTIENEVRLYRILDLQLKQKLGQKILGLGTIMLKTSDKSMHNFEIKNIAHPKQVKEMLSIYVEEQRKLNRISGREFMQYDEDDEVEDDV